MMTTFAVIFIAFLLICIINYLVDIRNDLRKILGKSEDDPQ